MGDSLCESSWDGNAADTEIVQSGRRRDRDLSELTHARYLVADSKLYNEANAANLRALGLITRIPHTLKLVSQVITQALRWDTCSNWMTHALSTGGVTPLRHVPPWLVVSSEAAGSAPRQPSATRGNAKRRSSTSNSSLCKPNALRLPRRQAALDTLAPAWKYHQVEPTA